MSQSFSIIIPKIFYLGRFPFHLIVTGNPGDNCANTITISLNICEISTIFHFCHSLSLQKMAVNILEDNVCNGKLYL